MKHDLSRLPALTPESLRGDRPAGPVHFSLHDAPERQRPESLSRLLRALRHGRRRRAVRRDVVQRRGRCCSRCPDCRYFPAGCTARATGARPSCWRTGATSSRCSSISAVPTSSPRARASYCSTTARATLVSTADPAASCTIRPAACSACAFPRNALGALVDGIEDLCLRPIRAETPALRLITDYVSLGREEPTFTDGPLQQLFVTHVHDLIAAPSARAGTARRWCSIAGCARRGCTPSSRTSAGNLDRADLSVGALAARHGCTPRFIQRLFETEGTTFTAYVLAQRLARAHDLLSDPRRRTDKITRGRARLRLRRRLLFQSRVSPPLRCGALGRARRRRNATALAGAPPRQLTGGATKQTTHTIHSARHGRYGPPRMLWRISQRGRIPSAISRRAVRKCVRTGPDRGAG